MKLWHFARADFRTKASGVYFSVPPLLTVELKGSHRPQLCRTFCFCCIILGLCISQFMIFSSGICKQGVMAAFLHNLAVVEDYDFVAEPA